MAIEKEGKALTDVSRRQIEEIIEDVQSRQQVAGQVQEALEEVKKLGNKMNHLERLFCTPDGESCFSTKDELDRYMQEQTKQMQALNGKIGDVVAKIRDLGQSQKPAPQGAGKSRKKWSDMSTEERQALLEEMDKLGYPHPAHYELVRQCSISGKSDACDMLRSALKESTTQEIIEKLPQDKQRGVLAFACRDGKCKPLREGMEKEEGVRIYKQDPKTKKWVWIDQPKEERSTSGFDLF